MALISLTAMIKMQLRTKLDFLIQRNLSETRQTAVSS